MMSKHRGFYNMFADNMAQVMTNPKVSITS